MPSIKKQTSTSVTFQNIPISNGTYTCLDIHPAPLSILADIMHHPHQLLFSIIFGLRCLAAADSVDLVGDDAVIMTSSSNIFNSPSDALTSPSSDAYEPFISLDDHPDLILFNQPSEIDRDSGNDRDLIASTTSPSLLSLDPEYPSEFHDGHPGSRYGPECDYPRLAACCDDGNMRVCVWFSPWTNLCENVDNVLCCEQVTAEGQGRGCQDPGSWPGIIGDQILDILRLAVPLPEVLPGGIWSGNE